MWRNLLVEEAIDSLLMRRKCEEQRRQSYIGHLPTDLPLRGTRLGMCQGDCLPHEACSFESAIELWWGECTQPAPAQLMADSLSACRL